MVASDVPSTACAEVAEERGDYSRVEAELGELEQMIEEGRRDLVVVLADRLIAMSRILSDDRDAARARLDEALHWLENEAVPEAVLVRSYVWQTIGELDTVAGDGVAAVESYRHALDACRQIYMQTSPRYALHGETIAAFTHQSNQLALRMWELGQFDKALQVFDQALAADARFPGLAEKVVLGHLELNRANTLVSLKRKDEALPAFTRAIAAYEQAGAAEALRSIGFAWIGRGNSSHTPEERIAAYEQAIATLEPLCEGPELQSKTIDGLAKAQYNLACEYRTAGQNDAALAQLANAAERMYEVVEHDPHPSYAGMLGMVRATRARYLAADGNVAAALDEMREAVSELEASLALTKEHAGTTMLAGYKQDITKWETSLARAVPVMHLPSRRPPPPPSEHDFTCSFCGRRRHEVFKLISGPRVFICDRCAHLALEIIDNDYPKGADGVRRGEVKPNALACGFCGKRERRCLVQGPHVVICDDCIDLCQDIVAEEIAKEQAEEDAATCAFCDARRLDVERLIVSSSVGLCNACFARSLAVLDQRYPRDHTGQRSGAPRRHDDRSCVWCATSIARAFIAAEPHALCDACIDAAAAAFGSR